MRPPHLDDEVDDDPALSDVPSREAVTPRGGFMARPGLKAPPRHAVVIRGGDVRPSENIPVARVSQPPPEPPSEPEPESASEKVTLRALRTPTPEPVALVVAPPVPVESVPPPSDTPVVASVRPAASPRLSTASRRARSRWTIVLAAAAGLLLGLASVAATRLEQPQSAAAAAPAQPDVRTLPVSGPPAAVERSQRAGRAGAAATPLPSQLPSADPRSEPVPQLPIAPSPRSGGAASKRSIF